MNLNYLKNNWSITNDLHNWLEAFLKDRRQRVVSGDSISYLKEVLSGVPEGSVLGLLFVLFINDLTEVVGNNIKLYTDDSKILAIVDTVI